MLCVLTVRVFIIHLSLSPMVGITAAPHSHRGTRRTGIPRDIGDRPSPSSHNIIFQSSATSPTFFPFFPHPPFPLPFSPFIPFIGKYSPCQCLTLVSLASVGHHDTVIGIPLGFALSRPQQVLCGQIFLRGWSPQQHRVH